MSGSNSNQDGAQRDRMLLEITMKKRKPFLFLIQTGVRPQRSDQRAPFDADVFAPAASAEGLSG